MSNDFLTENVEMIKAFFFNNEVKNSVLDPLTCIVRCAILSFKPVGTKLSINNNRISFVDPNFLQGTIKDLVIRGKIYIIFIIRLNQRNSVKLIILIF